MARLKTLPSHLTDEILKLAPDARKARRQHGDKDPKVIASRELTTLFKRLFEEGYAISAIAKSADMTYHSVSARIKSDD